VVVKGSSAQTTSLAETTHSIKAETNKFEETQEHLKIKENDSDGLITIHETI